MLKDTGERVIPEKMKITNNLLIEHIARYHFACNYVYGRVLDFASGAGYGTHIVAKKCKGKIDEIIGVDIDPDAVAYASGTYYHPLSSFYQKDVTDLQLPEKLGQFDCIVSFETIEHVQQEKAFLDNVEKMLKPGGVLIISTPFGSGRGIPSSSPFHVHQLTIKEFQDLFTNYEEQSLYFQKGALIEPSEYTSFIKPPLGIMVCKKAAK